MKDYDEAYIRFFLYIHPNLIQFLTNGRYEYYVIIFVVFENNRNDNRKNLKQMISLAGELTNKSNKQPKKYIHTRVAFYISGLENKTNINHRKSLYCCSKYS